MVIQPLSVRSIMITNISDKISLDQLKKYLEIYGKTKSVDLIKEKTVFAFCEYLSDKFSAGNNYLYREMLTKLIGSSPSSSIVQRTALLRGIFIQK